MKSFAKLFATDASDLSGGLILPASVTEYLDTHDIVQSTQRSEAYLLESLYILSQHIRVYYPIYLDALGLHKTAKYVRSMPDFIPEIARLGGMTRKRRASLCFDVSFTEAPASKFIEAYRFCKNLPSLEILRECEEKLPRTYYTFNNQAEPEEYYDHISKIYREEQGQRNIKEKLNLAEAAYLLKGASQFLHTLATELLPGVDLYGSGNTPRAIQNQVKIVIDAMRPVFEDAAKSLDYLDSDRAAHFLSELDKLADRVSGRVTERGVTAVAINAGNKIREAIMFLLSTEYPVDTIYSALSDAILDASDVR